MKKYLISTLGVLLSLATSASADGNAEYGGLCAWGLVQGKDVKTDCSLNWQDPSSKKTFCFSNEAAKKSWSTDVAGNMARAEMGYNSVKMKAQAQAMADAQMKQAQEQVKAAQGMMNSPEMKAQAGNPNVQQAQEQLKAAQAALDQKKAQGAAAKKNPAGTALGLGAGMVGGN